MTWFARVPVINRKFRTNYSILIRRRLLSFVRSLTYFYVAVTLADIFLRVISISATSNRVTFNVQNVSRLEMILREKKKEQNLEIKVEAVAFEKINI